MVFLLPQKDDCDHHLKDFVESLFPSYLRNL